MIGSGLSGIIRLQLSRPGNDFLTEHFYNVVLTGHGLIIIFWFVIPVLIGGFGNWFIPLILGGSDIAYPKINNASLWLLPTSLILLVVSTFLEGVGTG